MIKKLPLVLLFLCSCFFGFGQLNIANVSTNYTIDFDTNLSGVNNGTFNGSGWRSNTNSGQLDSDAWVNTGMSDDSVPFLFGQTKINGDHARGIANFGVSQGGWYAFDNSGDIALGCQPAASDWTPGSLTLRIQNNTGVTLTSIDVAYDILCFNDEDRGNSFNFSHSADDITYANENSLDYTSPNSSTSTLIVTNKSISLIGLSIPDGNYYYFRWTGNDASGSGSRDEFAIDNITISGSALTDDVDWANIQWPANGAINLGDTFYVYAQTWESGVTDSSGQGADVTAWIGYSSVNNDPEANDTSWTWVPASYYGDGGATGVENDEYRADIGAVIPAIGTYYYASRFELNGGPYRYGGYNGGFWDGTNNVSGVLTVNARTPDWVNLQSPGGTININTGDDFNVYAQINEPGITENSPATPGANIQAWIGYSAVDNDPETNDASWTWVTAGHNTLCGANCGSPTENNDEYFAEISNSQTLTAGTYYYASRFTIDDPDVYYYGGWSGSGGGFWDTVDDVSGILIITDPPVADVVITEIMYNSSGTDDEWIEICNISGSSQDLSQYSIEVAGTTEFTFPASTIIVDGTCITIALGDNGSSPFNPDCPFNPDYGAPSGTDNLFNNTIVLIKLVSSSSIVADSVTYDDDDGADGNGSSLHVINAALDNSDTGTNWQEVSDGGTAGSNTLLSNCAVVAPEIDIEHSTLASISNNVVPNTGNNTIFALTSVGDTTTPKTYFIRNEGNQSLTIDSFTNSNNIEFPITLISPTSLTYPFSLPAGNTIEFTVEFSPQSVGLRTTQISIESDDTDEDPYLVNLQGEADCAVSTNVIAPSIGPEGTIVTIIGADLLTATATYNGNVVSYINISDNELEVTIPNDSVTGNIIINDDQGCISTIPFTIIDDKISGCQGSGPALTELFISEVTDATYGSLTYIELYNATGSDIDLAALNYSIRIYANGSNSAYISQALSGTINDGDTYVLTTGTNGFLGDTTCSSITGGDGEIGDQVSTTLAGINIGYDEDTNTDKHDYVGLFKNNTEVDAFGVLGDNDWMHTVHTTLTGTKGFNFRRLNTATLPTTTFDDNDWEIIDWAGTGSSSCNVNDYSDIGVFDYSTGTPPTASALNLLSSNCDLTSVISVTGNEGFDSSGDTQELAYQWFYLAPGDSNWSEIISSNTNFSGQQTEELTIDSVLDNLDYQFYCQVREDDETCYQASNAIQIKPDVTTWTSSGWDNGEPDINTIVYIDSDYNTNTDYEATAGHQWGSFSACNLIINSGSKLTIADNYYVEVENNIEIDGEILVEAEGSLVQNNDLATVTLSSALAKNTMYKFTHPLQYWYDYTYWSSPLEDAQIETALFPSKANRRFVFNASLFNDILIEDGNTGTFSPGSDDIDDEGNDWVNQQTGSMLPGIGYAATHSTTGFVSNTSYQYIFEGTLASGGAFNSGDIEVDIFINPNVTYNNWNFIGNPYPSAINAQEFFSNTSSFLEGIIYLWSQSTNADADAPGNENENFSKDDYAMLNYAGGIAVGTSSPNGSNLPNGYIASGQGFFVIGNKSAVSSPGYYSQTVFNNSMRVTGNNNQFFKGINKSTDTMGTAIQRIWVNLASDNGVFSQILVAYVEGATNRYDGMSYDAERIASVSRKASIYSTINGENNKRFAIQGKAPKSLKLSEVIPVGFKTEINVPTLYKFSIPNYEGWFFETNTIYLKDKLLNTLHSLKESEYVFTSEVGEFNDRFEIVFREKGKGKPTERVNKNAVSDLKIIEFQNGNIKFALSGSNEFKNITILDLQGKIIYNLNANGQSRVFNLSNLRQTIYIAKVELSDGSIINQKLIKRQ